MILKPSRRDLLKLAAAAPAFAMPLSARAELGGPDGDNPAHFRFTIGDMRLTVVSDGFFTIPTSVLGVNADPDEVKAFLTRYFLSTEVHTQFTNHLVIETGDAKILVDVGSGNRWVETAGRLMQNLETAGIDPYEITHVIITHAHPDHIWGIRDDFDEAIIPDAEYIIGRVEHDYWLQDGLVNKVPEENQQFVVGAVNSLNADGVEWTLADDGYEVVPGVRMIATPGHTSGHMAVHVESEGKSLIALGDMATHAYMNFAHPEWYIARDKDGEQAGNTRKRIFDMAATDRMAVLGYHFPFPGVGHVQRDGSAYRFIPALWQFEE